MIKLKVLLFLFITAFVYSWISLVSYDWVDNLSRPDIIKYHWDVILLLLVSTISIHYILIKLGLGKRK